MNYAVVGLGFGDEGKGVVTDYLCSQNPGHSVMRFSGGHQAAHTVKYQGIEHVFSNFGSGTLRGAKTYWSKYCTFEPVGFCMEFDCLKSKKVDPKIYIAKECRVTTPMDIMANWRSIERYQHGTTGTGFWKTIERNQNGVTLTFGDLFEDNFWEKYKAIYDYYKQPHYDNADFAHAYFRVKQMLGKNIEFPNPPFGELILEGSQGLLLDKDLGYFPHVTPSKTNLHNALEMGICVDQVYLVTRSYQTRHGYGPITNEDLLLPVSEQYERATCTNSFQGHFRKTVLDLDQIEKAVKLGIDPDTQAHNIKKNLVVTCLDQWNLAGDIFLTHKHQLKRFDHYQEFVEYIARVLGIDGDVYGNWSPYSYSMEKIQ